MVLVGAGLNKTSTREMAITCNSLHGKEKEKKEIK